MGFPDEDEGFTTYIATFPALSNMLSASLSYTIVENRVATVFGTGDRYET
jgi:hypothetical protein